MEKQKNLQAQELSDENLSGISGGANVGVEVSARLTLSPAEEKFLKKKGINDPYAAENLDEVISLLQQGGFDVTESFTIKS